MDRGEREAKTNVWRGLDQFPNYFLLQLLETCSEMLDTPMYFMVERLVEI